MQMEPTTEFTVKLRGAPFNVKEVSEHKLSDFRDAVKLLCFENILCISVFVSLTPAYFLSVTSIATNSRVHDPTEACSNQDWEERKWK